MITIISFFSINVQISAEEGYKKKVKKKSSYPWNFRRSKRKMSKPSSIFDRSCRSCRNCMMTVRISSNLLSDLISPPNANLGRSLEREREIDSSLRRLNSSRPAGCFLGATALGLVAGATTVVTVVAKVSLSAS